MEARDDDHRPLVLLAGDNEGRRLHLCRLLRRYGYAVQLVTTPREVVHLVAMERPGLLLLDQVSLGGGTQQLIRMVRAAETHLAVVVLTAFGAAEDTISCLRAGATDYISLPAQPEEVLDIVQRALARPMVQ
ncbi:MAG TPA: response regulator [Chloroflexota bacterium]|jgi:CheY-like chemotaxis protein|nr:response regulator [Chloroflexota bacterium]